MTSTARPVNRFCWMDLKTRDIPGTSAFFSAVLGWRFAVDEDDWRRAVFISAGEHRIGSVSDLAAPVYPPGLPAHSAFYIAVDDADRRTEAAVAGGARLVLPPFDAGDQGRMATLVDPVGAVFSLWQAEAFGGWTFPAGTAGAPRSMVLTCPGAETARGFYRAVLGGPLAGAEFVAAPVPGGAEPQWEAVIGVEGPRGLEGVAARAREHGREPGAGPGERSSLRLSSPDGLVFRARALEG